MQLNISLADRLSQLRGNTIGEKRKADEIDDGYNNNDNCFDHLIGSAAEVGHLWSIARYILTTSHTSMTPIVFEAICSYTTHDCLWATDGCLFG